MNKKVVLTKSFEEVQKFAFEKYGVILKEVKDGEREHISKHTAQKVEKA